MCFFWTGLESCRRRQNQLLLLSFARSIISPYRDQHPPLSYCRPQLPPPCRAQPPPPCQETHPLPSQVQLPPPYQTEHLLPCQATPSLIKHNFHNFQMYDVQVINQLQLALHHVETMMVTNGAT